MIIMDILINSIAASIDPNETYRVTATIKTNAARHISAVKGENIKITANEVITPFPPLKPKNIGQLCPITTKKTGYV